MGVQGPDVPVVIVLLIAVAIVAVAVRYVRLPYTLALVLTGLALALAPNTPRVQLTPGVILTVFLPVLLFHGAYNLDLAAVRANLTPIILLAVPGVAVTAGLVGAALHAATGLSWSLALLFGTIIAATDPVAVLAIFGELGVPRRLSTIVNAESLFNDGTALVLFATMVGVASVHTVNLPAVGERFVVEVAGALALGAAVGVLGSTVLLRIDDALLETTITLIMAYGGFLLADQLGVSGPLETVVAGLLLGARGSRVMSPTTRLQARATWDFLDFLANSLLFLLIGLQLHPLGTASAAWLGGRVWWPLVVAIFAVVVARAVVVWAVAHLLEHLKPPLPRGWRTVISWAGLRGAVSLAAGLSLPRAVPQHDLLLALTFGVVLFTLLAQGLSMRRLLERLGLIAEEASRYDYEVALGRLRAAEAAAREVAVLRRDDALDDHLARRLEDGFVARRRELRTQIDAMYHGNAALERQQELEVMRRLLRVQREAVRDAYARGLLSNTALRDLVEEIDRDLARLEPALDDEG